MGELVAVELAVWVAVVVAVALRVTVAVEVNVTCGVRVGVGVFVSSMAEMSSMVTQLSVHKSTVDCAELALNLKEKNCQTLTSMVETAVYDCW